MTYKHMGSNGTKTMQEKLWSSLKNLGAVGGLGSNESDVSVS